MNLDDSINNQSKKNPMMDSDFSIINATVDYRNRAKITISDTAYDMYLVQVYIYYNNEWIIYHEEGYAINGYFFHAHTTIRHKWKFMVYGFDNDNIKLLLQNTYSEKNKNILFIFDTESSNIENEYVRKSLKFEKDNKCTIFIKSKFYNKLRKSFPDFNRIFDIQDTLDCNIYAAYTITQNEIATKKFDIEFNNNKFILQHGGGLSNITHNHRENWMEYSQEDVFDDIINHE